MVKHERCEKIIGGNVKQKQRGTRDFRSLQPTQRVRDYKIKDSLSIKNALKKNLHVYLFLETSQQIKHTEHSLNDQGYDSQILTSNTW